MPEANVKSGALLGFKVGLQSTVDTMLSQGTAAHAEHGCFYLTKDAHRLYVGNEDGSLSAVNEGIEWISKWADLQQIASAAASSVSGASYLTGRFYYVNDENVLCVYNGRKWVQLNENTNTTISGQAYSVSATNDVATVSNTITDSNNAEYTDSFTVTGANGIKITGTGKAITLTGDTYTLSSQQSGNNVQIKLDSSETTNDSTVTLVAGQNVTLTDNGSGSVSIAAKDRFNDSAAFSNVEGGGFRFEVTDNESQSVGANVDPKIAIYTTGNPTGTATNSVSFINGIATLDTYSRSAIDSKLQAVNAMTYRGIVGNEGNTVADSILYDSQTGNTSITKNGQPVKVAIGDTFLVTTAGDYNNVHFKERSLFIARAKDGASEGADGYLAANDVIFDVVAEQYYPDSTYSFAGTTNGIVLTESPSGAETGSFVVNSGDNWIGISESGSANKVLTVTHQNVTRNNTTGTAVRQTAGSNQAIPVITGVTTDAKGHITGVETTSYTVVDTDNGTVSGLSTTTSAYKDTTNNFSAGVINTTATITQVGGAEDTQTASVVVSSSSLSITDNDTRPTSQGGAVTPGGLQIEMVWGEF